MTREEAIVKFEKQLTSAMVVLDSGFGTKPGENNRLYWERKEMAEIALSALRSQQEQERNDPLTLDELRQMDGEPVWVVCDEEAVNTTPGFEPLAFWTLVEVCEESIFLRNNLGGRTEYAADVELEEDGITAYRRKPEEASK